MSLSYANLELIDMVVNIHGVQFVRE